MPGECLNDVLHRCQRALRELRCLSGASRCQKKGAGALDNHDSTSILLLFFVVVLYRNFIYSII